MLFRQVAPTLGVAPDRLVARGGRITAGDDPARSISFRDAAAGLRTDQLSAIEARADNYGGFRRRMGDANAAQSDIGGVQFAAVSVDTETGAIRVECVVAIQDCGRPMNPRLIESQVQGGVLMGISYAQLDQRVIDQHTGHIVNANLEQYKLAGPRETPLIEVGSNRRRRMAALPRFHPETCQSASGQTQPKTEGPDFGLAVAERTAVNPPYPAICRRDHELPLW